MSNDITAIDSIRRARFEHDVAGIMAARHPRQFALAQQFARQSQSFPALRGDILDHYFFERPHLSPLFAVDAMVQLVERMVAVMAAQTTQHAA